MLNGSLIRALVKAYIIHDGTFVPPVKALKVTKICKLGYTVYAVAFKCGNELYLKKCICVKGSIKEGSYFSFRNLNGEFDYNPNGEWLAVCEITEK